MRSIALHRAIAARVRSWLDPPVTEGLRVTIVLIILSPTLLLQGSNKDFVAFFGASGVCGRQRVHAILTRSTAGARALLQNSKLGFAAPLMPEGVACENSDDPAASGTQSMLLFEGGVRVHGLFDFLLNESWRLLGDACDVPLLLSPVPFLLGTLRAHDVKVGLVAASAPALQSTLDQRTAKSRCLSHTSACSLEMFFWSFIGSN